MKDRVRNRWKFLCVFVAVAMQVNAAGAQQVLTESGTVSGIHTHGLSVYRGIPFAAPPLGDLRWRPPARAASWTGTRKAEAFAPACMQVGVSMPSQWTLRSSFVGPGNSFRLEHADFHRDCCD